MSSPESPQGGSPDISGAPDYTNRRIGQLPQLPIPEQASVPYAETSTYGPADRSEILAEIVETPVGGGSPSADELESMYAAPDAPAQIIPAAESIPTGGRHRAADEDEPAAPGRHGSSSTAAASASKGRHSASEEDAVNVLSRPLPPLGRKREAVNPMTGGLPPVPEKTDAVNPITAPLPPLAARPDAVNPITAGLPPLPAAPDTTRRAVGRPPVPANRNAVNPITTPLPTLSRSRNTARRANNADPRRATFGGAWDPDLELTPQEERAVSKWGKYADVERPEIDNSGEAGRMRRLGSIAVETGKFVGRLSLKTDRFAGRMALRGVRLIGRGVKAYGNAGAAGYGNSVVQPGQPAETRHISVADQDAAEGTVVNVIPRSSRPSGSDLTLRQVQEHARRS